MPPSLNPLALSCPHCAHSMQVRTSHLLSPLFRRLYLFCTATESCGYRCVASLTLTKTLSPSFSPRPDVDRLPLVRRSNG